ncbi:hypothetical protein AYJ57_13700 [Salipiger sp. CCB-MM3]|uniref:GNAT family N-acetyltransferase n=1 Tax=Salipiger sp. CCB-MM3 TaxID=1792508 RepID=UPI00080AB668|nr:GNAT family N-acetyltransferase [Salipiger sp. CCB-MM3]ANT61335.1 hypothetical protein AYJ57_13700 [Salipiger sp. CCB-MM3]
MDAPCLPLTLPLPQSPQYARACAALGTETRGGTLTGSGSASGREWLHWQTQARHLPGLGRVELLSRGPVTRDCDAPAPLDAWFEGFLAARPRGPLLLNADGTPPEVLRRAGFWPLLTPASLALLPLGPETEMRAALAQKWRNRLNRAQRSGLRLRRLALRGDHWLLPTEAAQARARRYRNLPPGFLAAYAAANPGDALIWEARLEGAPVAAIAVLRHGLMASWTSGVTRPEGRRSGAMNLLLWEAARWLAAQGHLWLDMGILNQQDAPGLTHFKLGTGARVHRLGGTWMHSRALAPLARRLPSASAR